MSEHPNPPEALGSRAASSVAWLTLQTWVAKVGGFVTVVILARLLTPTDFGLVAIATTVVPVVYLIADLGFGTYLMQSDRMDRVVASTAFWYSALSGLALAGLLIVLSPLLEALFGVAGVGPVIASMSPAVVFVSLAAVPIALLRRGMRFRALAVQAGTAAITAQFVAIVLALIGAGVWALVAQVCVSQGVTLVMAWVSARWWPSRDFRWPEFRTMLAFGSKVVGINAIEMIRQWGENAIISNVLGAAALGKLSVAQRLVQTSQEVAGAAIAPVSTVVFAQVREDSNRLQRGYDRALGLSYLVIAPALTAVLVTAPALVPLLFGAQWAESVGPAQALSVAAVFTVGANLDRGLFYGLGRPGVWLVYATTVDLLTVAVTAVMVWHGIFAVAVGFVGVAAAATLARVLLVARLVGVPPWRIFRRILAALIAMSLSAGSGWAVMTILQHDLAILAVAVSGLTILLVHLGVSRVMLPDAFRDMIREVKSRFRRRASA